MFGQNDPFLGFTTKVMEQLESKMTDKDKNRLNLKKFTRRQTHPSKNYQILPKLTENPRRLINNQN